MPTAEAGSGSDPDPHGLAATVAPLGGSTRRDCAAAFATLATMLAPGERVQSLIAGRFLGFPGVAGLTDRRLLMVNGREWKPDVVEVPLAVGTEVKGWQQDRMSTITVVSSGAEHVIDRIEEATTARDFAGALRARVG